MASSTIGSITKVQSGQVEVRISTSELNLKLDGRTYRVGQIGAYATIPLADHTLIGFVMSSEQEPGGPADTVPAMIITVQLLGEIRDKKFSRGVTEYPIVGDPVCAAGRTEFEAIFGSHDESLEQTEGRSGFVLGKFAYNTDFEVKVRGSEFFAKHVCLVGNSGSGKSCTTARIIQEVLDMKESQVILFDMHGEYRAAFSDEAGHLRENVTYLGTNDLVLPYWLLKYEELEDMFVDRSNPINVSTQISFLRTALLEFKQEAAQALDLTEFLTLDTPIHFSLEKLKTYAENLNDARFVLNDDRYAFSQLALRSLTPQEQGKLMRNQRCQFNRGNPEGETPHPLYFGKLLGLIDLIDTKFNDRRYEFLLKPVEHGRKSRYFRDHIKDAEASQQNSDLMNHLIKLLTGHCEPRSNLTIIDLSGIPFEIVDNTVAVLTRLLFDLNFWTAPDERHPILMVFEEAHNYIPREPNGRDFAKKAVERVAKEGRKYGVSAMIVSQRPSELSETVMSQCNSFCVMRLSNPEDQHYISKVVGDHFAGLVQMVPVLRPGEALVLGDSVPMPMRTLVTRPSPEPQSGDMDFFRNWSTCASECDVDKVIDNWRRQNRSGLNGAPVERDEEPAGETPKTKTAASPVATGASSPPVPPTPAIPQMQGLPAFGRRTT